MKRVLLMGVVVLTVAIAGCATPSVDDSGQDASDELSDGTTEGDVVYTDVPRSGEIVRFIDEDASLVCYVFGEDIGDDGAGGLSCVPLNETSLNK